MKSDRFFFLNKERSFYLYTNRYIELTARFTHKVKRSVETDVGNASYSFLSRAIPGIILQFCHTRVMYIWNKDSFVRHRCGVWGNILLPWSLSWIKHFYGCMPFRKETGGVKTSIPISVLFDAPLSRRSLKPGRLSRTPFHYSLVAGNGMARIFSSFANILASGWLELALPAHARLRLFRSLCPVQVVSSDVHFTFSMAVWRRENGHHPTDGLSSVLE